LKMLKRSPSRRMTSGGSSGGPSSPVSGGTPFHHSMSMYRPRRPMTSAEIMRQQMKVTEHNDNRLRKTIMRTLVGQVSIYTSRINRISDQNYYICIAGIICIFKPLIFSSLFVSFRSNNFVYDFYLIFII
jgi:hypothetical protein